LTLLHLRTAPRAHGALHVLPIQYWRLLPLRTAPLDFYLDSATHTLTDCITSCLVDRHRHLATTYRRLFHSFCMLPHHLLVRAVWSGVPATHLVCRGVNGGTCRGAARVF